MKNSRRKSKEEGESIAVERIKILFSLADRSALSGDLALATNQGPRYSYEIQHTPWTRIWRPVLQGL
jgi:hypothetical protein